MLSNLLTTGTPNVGAKISLLPNLFLFSYVSAEVLRTAVCVYLTQKVVVPGVLRKLECEISRNPGSRGP